MGVFPHAIPRHVETRAVGAEHRIRRVVGQRVVSPFGDHGLGVLAGRIVIQPPCERPAAVGQHGQLLRVSVQPRGGRFAADQDVFAGKFGRPGVGMQPRQVGKHPPQRLGGRAQFEPAHRLQQHVPRAHQRVADAPVDRLAEIAAFGVLQVRPARQQRDLHVRQRRAGQHALVGVFEHVGFDQPLPVQRQVVHMAGGGEADAAAPRAGIQPQVHLGVVAQRLIMADAVGRRGDGLHVAHAAGSEIDVDAEALPDQVTDHLQLDRAHHLQLDALVALVPGHAQRRLLFLQPPQAFQHAGGMNVRREQHPGGHHRFDEKAAALAARADEIPGAHAGQSRRGHQVAGFRRRHRPVLRPVVDAKLVHLRRPLRRHDLVPGVQPPGDNLQKHHPPALGVEAHLARPRQERVLGMKVVFRPGERRQHPQELPHALVLQRRARHQREDLPAPDLFPQRVQPGFTVVAVRQPRLQQRLVVGGHGLGSLRGQRAVRPEGAPQVQNVARQAIAHRAQRRFRVRPGAVGLVQEQERRHAVALQQPPHRLRMALHALGAADHQHRVVHHADRALHFGGEIHVARRVHPVPGVAAVFEAGLVREDGDAARLLQRMDVQKRIPVIHPARRAQRVGVEQRLFGKRGLAGVHVRQYADRLFHGPNPVRPGRCPVRNSCFLPIITHRRPSAHPPNMFFQSDRNLSSDLLVSRKMRIKMHALIFTNMYSCAIIALA